MVFLTRAPWLALLTVLLLAPSASSVLPDGPSEAADEVASMVPVHEALWGSLEDALGPAFAAALQEVYLAHGEPDLWQRNQRIQESLPALQAAATNLEVLDDVPTGCHIVPGIGHQVCIAGTGDDVHNASAEKTLGAEGDLFIDLGGDDVYNGASGSFGDTGGIFIDLGGDDAYEVDGSRSVCRNLCGTTSQSDLDGAWGARGGIFLDVAGDDSHRLHGVGYYDFVLHVMGAAGGLYMDLDGNDDIRLETKGQYRGLGSFCLPCIGASGIGADGGTFVDAAGSDTYYTIRHAFGVGGLALELGGDDHYQVDDHYADVFGVGGGGLGGNSGLVPGVFIDVAGHDRYEVLMYSSDAFGNQGSFMDLGGDDLYHLAMYPLYVDAFGYGTDLSPGRFIDVGGEDTYPITPKGSQNGIFIDTQGTQANNSRIVGDYDDTSMDEAMPEQVESPTTELAEASRDTLASMFGVEADWRPRVAPLGGTIDYDIEYHATLPARIHIQDSLGRTMFGPDEPPADIISEGFHFTPSGSQSGTARFTPSQEGQLDIELRVHPVVGSTHLRREILTTLTVDGGAPELSVDLQAAGAVVPSGPWYNTSAPSIHVTASDALAGMARLFVSLDPIDIQNGTPVQQQTPDVEGFGDRATWYHNMSLASLPDGQHTVHVVAIDAVGHTTYHNATVNLDRTAPNWDLQVSNGTLQNGWWTEVPDIRLSADDAHAGLDTIEATWSGATEATYPSLRLPADIAPAFNDGLSRLDVHIADAARPPNKASVGTLEMNIDRAPPVTQAILPSSLTVPVAVDLFAEDATSGVARTQYEAILDQSHGAEAERVLLDEVGNWTLRFRSQDKAGNWESWQTVRINVTSPPPQATFESPLGAQAMEPVQFQDTSDDDGQLTAWQWDFGDGSGSTEQHPEHTYQRSGTYTVTLTVTDEWGQTGSHSVQYTVANHPPAADFTWTPERPIAGQQVTFTDASVEPDGHLVQRTWDIDGQETQGDTAVHTFAAGQHEVRLHVVDDEGAVDTITKSIDVLERVPLEVDLGFTPAAPTTMDDVEFLADVSIDHDDVVAWHWQGIDGDGASVQARFDPGQHTVRITVTDIHGDTADADVTFDVAGMAPVAAFTASAQQVVTHDGVTFTDASTDADGTIVQRTWDFGDGETSDATSPTHVFTDDGLYEVRLAVTDDDGLQHASTLQVVVANQAPTVEISAPERVSTMQTATFQAVATDLDGDIVAITWDIAGQAVASGATTGHAFDRPGTYTIHAKASDDDGTVATATHEIIVDNRLPEAAFSMPASVEAGVDVSFLDASTDPDGDVVAWAWDFGDATSTDRHPTHVFETPGSTTVTLEVTDDHGGRASISKQIQVQNRLPVVSLDGPSALQAGEPASFTATATDPDGSPLDYAWNLGGSGEVLQHAFDAPGSFEVRVVVTDAHGGRAEDTLVVDVAPAPLEVKITVPDDAVAGQPVRFGSAIDLDGEYAWVFGDGNVSTEAAPIHTYAAPGTYDVRLVVTSGGASATDHVQVVVDAPSNDADAADDDAGLDDAASQDRAEEAPLPVVVLLAALVIAAARRR